MNNNRTLAIVGGVIALLAAIFVIPMLREAYLIRDIVAKNTAARGGEEAWSNVESLRLAGVMEIGQGLEVPYFLEQKRPEKMRLEFMFDGQPAIQAFDGTNGWKVAPYTGKTGPQPLSEEELAGTKGSSDPWGLLFHYDQRGHALDLLGEAEVDGRAAWKLQVTLPGGSTRTVYLDKETHLELMVESTRYLLKKELLVTTRYSDWKEMDGLVFARRQDSQTAGDEKSHYLTVDTVKVNPQLPDSRFQMPAETAPPQ